MVHNRFAVKVCSCCDNTVDAVVFIVFRQNVGVSCEKAGEMIEAENLQAENGGDVSLCTNSECVNPEQLQVQDCSCNASTEVTNNIAVSASPCSDEQCNSSEAQTTDVISNCATVSCQHSSSTVVENRGSFEQFPADVSISEATVSQRDKTSDESGRNLHAESESTEPASVTAESMAGKTLSNTVRQLPVEMLPKPTYVLLPISSLLVVVNAGMYQSIGDRTRLPAIAPRPADVVSSSACLPAVSQDNSTVVGHRDQLHGDALLPRKHQKSVSSVVTQTSSLPAHPRCQTAVAATQTSERFAPTSRLSKESRASQVTHDVC